MKHYYCYIKSHTDYPDWEMECNAYKRYDAIRIFSALSGWGEAEIAPYVEEVIEHE